MNLIAMSTMDIIMLIAVPLATILLCALIVVAVKRREGEAIQRGGKEELDTLVIKKGYLNDSEKAFYAAGFKAAKRMNAYIFPNVELDEIVENKTRRGRYSNIFFTPIRFVLFTQSDLAPILIIDLYDKRMGTDGLGEMNKIMKRYVKASGIPVLTIEAKDSYNFEDLIVTFEDAMRRSGEKSKN